MAMAAFRREGRRFAPLITPQPITAVRSSLISEYDPLSLSLSLYVWCVISYHDFASHFMMLSLSSVWLLRKHAEKLCLGVREHWKRGFSFLKLKNSEKNFWISNRGCLVDI